MSVFYPTITPKKENSKSVIPKTIDLKLFLFLTISILSVQLSYSQENAKKELTVKEQIQQSVVPNNSGIPVEKLEFLYNEQQEMRRNQGLEIQSIEQFLKEQNYLTTQRVSNADSEKALLKEREAEIKKNYDAKFALEKKVLSPFQGVDYKVFNDKQGQVSYQVTSAGDVIFSRQIISIRSDYDKKVQAEKEAIYAANTLRRNLNYPKDALLTEIKNLTNQQNNNTNRSYNSNNTQNTLADYTFNGGGGSIPGTGTSGPASPYPSIINVSGVPTGATVKNVIINGLTHTWADDVDIVLQSPTGVNVILMSDAGGSGALSNHNYTFSDAAALALQDAAVSASGTYLPTNFGTGDNYPAPGPLTAPSAVTLSTFGNGSHNGDWKLFIVDDAGGDVGSWTSWSITFTDPIAACFPITITSQPANTTVCPLPSPASIATFTVGATPAGVSYNWQVNDGSGFVYLTNGGVYSGVNTATLTITGVTAALNGYQYRCIVICSQGGLPEVSNPATLTVSPPPPAAPTISPTSAAICPGGNVALNITSSQGAPSANVSSGTINLPITDANPHTTSNLLVAGFPGSVSAVSVNFNITHTWDGDLTINLIAPNGNILNLVNSRGGSADNFTNTTISSASATSLGTGTAPFTGTFAADAVLSAGQAPYLSTTSSFPSLFTTPNGTWTLVVTDNAGGDVGILINWSITITGPAVPDPAVWTPAAGLFNDVGLTSQYIAGTYQTTVYASPASTTTYSAQVTNGTCISAASTATVTVNAPPAITVQPTGANACVGTIKTFSVTATGTGLSYQWQVDPGSGFVNISNVSPYSGATTNTLTITSVPNAFNGFKYRCRVTGACPPILFSDEITLVVNQLPVITVSPSNQCSPVLLTASGANTYTWSPSGSLSASTGSVVTATTPVSTTYFVTGTNSTTGCANTGSVFVIGTPNTPTISPASATICLGSSQLLSVSGVANYSNTGAIQIPASPNTIGIASPYPSTINVSGLAASGVTVKSVTLSGISHTWMDDIDIVLQSPTGVNVVLMSDIGASTNSTSSPRTYTLDDAAASLLATTNPASPSGTYRCTNNGSSDTWTGPGPGLIVQASPSLSMFGAGNQNGTWRLFIVDDVGGDAGQLSGGWTITFATGASTVVFSPTTGLFDDAGLTMPYMGGQTTQVYASPASTTTYTAVASNTGPASNSTVTYSGPAMTVASSGPFSVYPATLNVSGLPTTGVKVKSIKINGFSHTFPDDVDVLLQSPTGTNVVLMSDVGGLVDNYDVNYTIMDGTTPFNLSGFNPPGIYSPTNDGATDTWSAPLPSSITQASPALSMFTGDSNGTWNLFARDDAGGDGGSIQSFEITFEYGNTVCSSPPRTVTVTVHIPIVFTTHPLDRTACQNDNVSFNVAATGTIQTTQWQVGTSSTGPWTNIAGATSTTLNLTSVQPSMSGNWYRCQMSNVGCGIVNSDPARLIVNPLPTVSLSLNPGGQTQLRPGMLTTVSVNSSPAGATYEWFINGVLQSGITGSSYVVDAYRLGTYTVRVTDVNGCKNTTAGVTFTALPTSNLFVYPNPTSAAYSITYYMPQVGSPITINVIDMAGHLIEQRFAVTTAPYTRFDFSASGLAAGVYVIEFRDPGGDRLAAGRLVVSR